MRWLEIILPILWSKPIGDSQLFDSFELSCIVSHKGMLAGQCRGGNEDIVCPYGLAPFFQVGTDAGSSAGLSGAKRQKIDMTHEAV